MLAAKATRRCIDSHHLVDARVQSPGVCTQSVMSTVVIRSNLMGCQTMDARSDVDEETENQRAELGGHQHLNARGTLACTRCRQCPHGVPCPLGSFLSDDSEDRKRARQKLPSLMAENGNAYTTCAYLSPTPGFFAPFYYCQCLCPYGQRCSDTNDGRLNKGWSLHTIFVCTCYA